MLKKSADNQCWHFLLWPDVLTDFVSRHLISFE